MKNRSATWSIMHPTPLDVPYFQRVAAVAEGTAINAFEICGDCHGTQSGLDGLYAYDEYTGLLGDAERAAIGENRRRLNQITEISHASGRALLFWHREAVAPLDLPQRVPGLLDENGEFDFFGDAFRELVRRKINGALAACPGIDGLVLTLTEAQYSVIHPSDPERYPTGKVVEHITLLFAKALKKRGKSFVLRSFGSTPEDYETILEGAERAASSASSMAPATFPTCTSFGPSWRTAPPSPGNNSSRKSPRRSSKPRKAGNNSKHCVKPFRPRSSPIWTGNGAISKPWHPPCSSSFGSVKKLWPDCKPSKTGHPASPRD